MSWLLDTCVISEVRRKKPSDKVLGWLESKDDSDLFISAFTIGELRKGAMRLTDARRRRRLLDWIHGELTAQFEDRILDFGQAAATAWGDLMATAETNGVVLPTLDSLIAATAHAHGLTVVTRDIADLGRTGVEFVNPWH